MKTKLFQAMALILGTAALGACGQRGDVQPTAEIAPAPAPVAPVAAAPAAPAPVASACGSTCPAPAIVAPAVAQPRRATHSADDRLAVKRFVLARGVKDREPVDAGTRFKRDAHKVYAFVEIENPGRAPAEIVVEFEPPGGGAAHGDVTLAVGAAARWRTWAYTRTASTAGTWTAVVKNKKGEVLARAPFEVTL